jgi:hypothetical protein
VLPWDVSFRLSSNLQRTLFCLHVCASEAVWCFITSGTQGHAKQRIKGAAHLLCICSTHKHTFPRAHREPDKLGGGGVDASSEAAASSPNADLINVFLQLKELNKDHKFKASANQKVGAFGVCDGGTENARQLCCNVKRVCRKFSNKEAHKSQSPARFAGGLEAYPQFL